MKFLNVLVLSTALAACALPSGDAMPPGTGMAFGAFDLTQSDIAISHVVLMRISPAKMYMGGAGERSTVTYRDGRFHATGLEPGLYAITSFYSGNQNFGLKGGLQRNQFRVEAGKAAYAGSYRLKYESGGWFRSGQGEFDRIDSPAREAELRKWLADRLAASAARAP